MKNFIIIIIILLSLQNVFSQGFVNTTEKFTNLNDIKKELTPYFEKQKKEIGDQAFFHEGSEYTSYKKFLDYWNPILHPHGDFSKYYKAEEVYWKNYQKTFNKQNKDLDNTDDWFELGPYKDTENISYGIGPIEFVSINKNNPSQILAGSLNGGLFYSSDNSNSWINFGSDDWENSGCVNAIFHPYLQNVYYACSSRKSDNGNPSYIGSQGKIKRKVGGVWTTIGDYDDFEGNHYTRYYKLLADPLNNDGLNGVPLRLYVATQNGLYFTDQANEPLPINWTKDPSPLLNGKIYDIEFVPNQTGSSANRMIATVYYETSDSWKVVYTTNRGLTWHVLPNHPSLNGASNYLTIEVSDADSNSLYIYFGQNSRTLYQYNWSSLFWTEILHLDETTNFGSCHAFGVSNTDINHLAVNSGTGIKITSNGGDSWSYKHTGHSDVEDIVWHPNIGNNVFVANHGGVYTSLDNGNNYNYKSNGIGNAEVEGMSTSYTDPGRIALGLFHDGSIVSLNSYSEDFEPSWHKKGYSDGLKPLIDYTNPDRVWITDQTSHDNSFKLINDINVGTSSSLYDGTLSSTGWEKCAVLNIENPNIIYFNFKRDNGNKDIIRADEYGVTDRQIISDFEFTHGLTNFFVYRLYTDPNNPNILYAYVVDKSLSDLTFRVFRTKKVNETPTAVISSWEELEIPNNERWISDINVSYQHNDLVYFSYSSNIQNYNTLIGQEMFYSVDYSSTNNCILDTNCFNLTGDLPNAATGKFSTTLEKGSNEGVYFSTNFGVYFSNKNMTTGSEKNWVNIGGNLPNVIPFGLEINYKINKIRIAYHGRGVWEHDLFCPNETDVVESGIYLNDQFIEVTNNIVSNAIILPNRDIDYRAGKSIELNPGFTAFYKSDFYAFIHPCNTSGNSFKSTINLEDNNVLDKKLTTKVNLISIFPNPTTHVSTLQINDFNKNDSYVIQIYNTQGQLIKSYEAINKNTELNLDNFNNGLYIVKVSNGKKTETIKLIKK